NIIESAIVDLKQIVIPIEKNASKQQLKEKINFANDISKSLEGCQEFINLAKEMNAEKNLNLGKIKINSTPNIIKEKIVNLKVGKISKPVINKGRIQLFMICKKENTKPIKVKKINIEKKISQRKINSLIKKYMVDLRQTAIIDIR
ncbi:peptidylprolyl isomerase, partial [Alphaproteobacteria bacterium]|nr:peptidylprolyl isomerase [Alphaproteobacteria bacterium]